MRYLEFKLYIENRLKTELPESLSYHSYEHTLDVLHCALFYANEYNLSEYEKELLAVAVLLHDSGFIYTTHQHEEKSCELAQELLPKFDYGISEINQICGMIRATKIPQVANNLLEEIICDADLDYLGREDFWEIGNKLYAELIELKIIRDRKDWDKLQIDFLEKHKYFSEYALLNREPKKQEHLAKVKSRYESHPEQTAQNIVVPIDFTPITENALQYACTIAAKNSDAIQLIHIVKKGELNINSIDIKLKNLASEYSKKYSISIHANIKEGSIFSDIAEFAEEIKAVLIIMGTHGVKGMQYVIGAFAIKVISSSTVPVLITQAQSKLKDSFSRIVIPIDHTGENKQKALQTIQFAKIFNSEVYLFKQNSGDEDKKNRTQLNLNFFKKLLLSQDVNCYVEEMSISAKDFHKEFIKFAEKISADLIIILTSHDKGIIDYVLGPTEQQVINNTANIPVMCVNPLQLIYTRK